MQDARSVDIYFTVCIYHYDNRHQTSCSIEVSWIGVGVAVGE